MDSFIRRNSDFRLHVTSALQDASSCLGFVLGNSVQEARPENRKLAHRNSVHETCPETHRLILKTSFQDPRPEAHQLII